MIELTIHRARVSDDDVRIGYTLGDGVNRVGYVPADDARRIGLTAVPPVSLGVPADADDFSWGPLAFPAPGVTLCGATHHTRIKGAAEPA